ncbi:MAG TPA: ABC transporter permease subunit [Candidatus Eubacterium avistercoris]|uniref:ABC transporter permease subunit n=1 Tax=Candidatus Eubacterium avistercoris TaxID=2838567 RepID=A0A9D2D1J5_9FIRM|nr:ABC transporter permease subunit [Candidatus Eubacterium avistercoris]
MVIALLAPLLAPNDPYETNLLAAQAGLSPEYPLGTDSLGRCMLSRVLYGARLSIFTSLLITAIVFFVGMTIGSLCGYFGGIVDLILNKIITIMQAFPQIILAIAITGIMGIGIRNTIIALCMVLWVDYARLSRSFVFSVKDRDFIKAAKVCGESDMRILFKRVIPNIMKPLIVNASLGIASTIMEIAALSYLGAGVKEPQAEWGAMINLGRNYIQSDLKMVLIPGAAIFITAAVFHMFGEKLRDRLK